jgi:hypothetical protein
MCVPTELHLGGRYPRHREEDRMQRDREGGDGRGSGGIIYRLI